MFIGRGELIELDIDRPGTGRGVGEDRRLGPIDLGRDWTEDIMGCMTGGMCPLEGAIVGRGDIIEEGYPIDAEVDGGLVLISIFSRSSKKADSKACLISVYVQMRKVFPSLE